MQHLNGQPTEDDTRTLSQSVILAEHEVELLLKHLQNVSKNRKRSAAKAAAKRQKKQSHGDTCCGVCKKPYSDETDEVEKWIQCDNCNGWCHFNCVELTDEPNEFFVVSVNFFCM